VFKILQFPLGQRLAAVTIECSFILQEVWSPLAAADATYVTSHFVKDAERSLSKMHMDYQRRII
jgi:hypothetical protein